LHCNYIDLIDLFGVCNKTKQLVAILLRWFMHMMLQLMP